MALGLFRAIFQVEGNAVPQLEQIVTASHHVTSAAAGMISPLSTLRNTLKSIKVQGTDNFRTMQFLDKSFQRIAISGRVTSTNLLDIATGLQKVSNVAPQVATRLNQVTSNLIDMSAKLKIAEQAARKAGQPAGGFQMMRDVSQGTADNFRKISAASQGLMISMSLLSRNAMGLAFSLIFLQFSGFLKISLTVAGFATALGFAALGIRSLVREGKSIQQIKDTLFLLTGTTESYAAMLSAAKVLSRDLAFVTTKELLQSLSSLEKDGFEVTNDQLNTFAEALQIFNIDGAPKSIKSVEDLESAFKDFVTEGKDVDDFFLSLQIESGKSWQAFNNSKDVDFKPLQRKLNETKDTFFDTFADPSIVISTWWMTFQIGWLEQFVSWRELFSSNWKSALPIVFDIGPLKSIFDAVITDTAIGIYDGLIKPFAQFASWLGIGFVNVIKAGYLGVTNFFMNIGNTIGGYLKAPFIAFKDWITPWWNSFIDILPAGLKKILGVEPIIIAPPVIPNPVPPPSVNPIPGFDSGRNFSENNTPIDLSLIHI